MNIKDIKAHFVLLEENSKITASNKNKEVLKKYSSLSNFMNLLELSVINQPMQEDFLDNINALSDQCNRLIWLDKFGYKRLAFDYVQPPLNPFQEACLNLTPNVKADGLQSLPSNLAYFHLERFFILAVFKGKKSRIDNYYHIQNG